MPRQLLAMCRKQLLLNLVGLRPIKIAGWCHDTNVKVTGFESSSVWESA